MTITLKELIIESLDSDYQDDILEMRDSIRKLKSALTNITVVLFYENVLNKQDIKDIFSEDAYISPGIVDEIIPDGIEEYY